MYCFNCTKCKFNFEVLCEFENRKKQKCPQCKKKKDVENFLTTPNILGPTSSKMDNFGYRAGYNYDKAQKESSAAHELAAKKGTPGYRNIDDISSGMNFDPSAW